MLSHSTILTATSRGAQHSAQSKPNQDSVRTFSSPDKEIIIIAIADGHGSAKHYLSHHGSDIATRISLQILRSELSSKSFESIVHEIENVKESIVTTWKECVYSHYTENIDSTALQREMIARARVEEYYGTTLTILALHNLNGFLLSIGDCDCFYQMLDSPVQVVDALGTFNRGPGEETDSLCSSGAANRFALKILDFSSISAVLLATDGMYKSLESDADIARIIDYYSSRIYLDPQQQAIQDDIKEQSLLFAEKGSGDDCTMVFLDLGRGGNRITETAISYPKEWEKRRQRNNNVSLPVFRRSIFSFRKSIQLFISLVILSILSVPLLEFAAQALASLNLNSLDRHIKSLTCSTYVGFASPIDLKIKRMCMR